jgi:formamidopyrimidine-DNA glycosylase
MPELPEVETTRRGIEPATLGRRILYARVRDTRLRWPVPAKLNELLCGQQVRAVGRRAKYLLLGLDHGTLIVHLGMSGSLRVLPQDQPALKHDHVDLVLDSGVCLRFNDPRRFGSMIYTTDEALAHPLLRRLAPEPLDPGFDGDYLVRVARGRKVAIKQFLMNGLVVVGVGNIYANESLFRAGIHPRRSAGRIAAARLGRLAQAIREVLSDAIEVGGTTLRDYVNAAGTPGYFRQKLYVYERAGEPCRLCRTPIRQLTQGQRSTYYCPRCQR